jgi:hypothetical protein
MTQQTLVLPLQRTTPLYIPRRDLVLGSSDSLTLTVTVVDRDDPAGVPLDLTGGIGGPACMLAIWPDRHWHGWDYGWGACWGSTIAGPATTLWTGVGTIDPTIPGTFNIFIPVATMGTWPVRCRWAVLLDWNGGGNAEMLAEGNLHVRPMVSRSIVPTIMLTDPTPAVLTDNPVDAIFIDGVPPA